MEDFEKMIQSCKEKKFFPIYTKSALARRWGVHRRTVHKRSIDQSDFCKPVHGLIKGPGTYYPLYEVERYERDRYILRVNDEE